MILNPVPSLQNGRCLVPPIGPFKQTHDSKAHDWRKQAPSVITKNQA